MSEVVAEAMFVDDKNLIIHRGRVWLMLSWIEGWLRSVPSNVRARMLSRSRQRAAALSWVYIAETRFPSSKSLK